MTPLPITEKKPPIAYRYFGTYSNILKLQIWAVSGWLIQQMVRSYTVKITRSKASVVAKALFAEVICRYSAPLIFVSDKGHNFLSKYVAAMCELLDIACHHTSSYHSQTQSTVERLTFTIAQSLKMYAYAHSNWQLLPGIKMTFRMSLTTQSTQYSAYALVFGKKWDCQLTYR